MTAPVPPFRIWLAANHDDDPQLVAVLRRLPAGGKLTTFDVLALAESDDERQAVEASIRAFRALRREYLRGVRA